jgi:Peptidase S46
VNTKYKFDVTPEFLGHLQSASVKLPGGAGGFASQNGLILTNQHLVTACLGQSLNDGFYAATQSAERKCDGMEAAVLLGIDDVTAQVAGLKNVDQRNAAIAKIEKDCVAKSGGRCSVVKFFSGGRYDLYRYKVYSDVRLVFAPENELAFFGRQHDSITYLRYGLDAAFLRAYENGKPAATPNYLKWSSAGLSEGDVVFAAGDPVSTNRLATAAQLTFYRDRALPVELPRLATRIQALTAFAATSEAHRRAAEPALTELAGEYKITAGKLIGLRDDRMIARKVNFEGKVKRAAERDPKIGTKGIEVWNQVEMAYRMWQPNERAYELLESHAAPGSVMFKIARQLLRGEEPDMRAVDEDVETLLLAQYLDELKTLNDRDAPTKALLAGKPLKDTGSESKKAWKREDPDLPKADKQAERIDVTPGKALLSGRSSKEVASEAIKATALKDPAERRKLAGNKEAARKSDDALLRLVAIIEDSAQRVRKRHDEVIGSLDATAAEKIAQYRFKLFGAAEYPDATGTPRVEFGVVKGYTDRAGVAMPIEATFSGLYYRANNDGPYLVPKRWVDQRGALNEVAPLNFVTTCDIGGGDYGSPVVNRAGELIGVTFDGNLESLPDTFLYTDEQARAVHVSAQGIVEALRKVYKATALLDELGASNASVSAAARSLTVAPH